MRLLGFAFLFFTAASDVWSRGPENGALEGRVVARASNEAITGARVTIDGTKMGATADADGKYMIADIPPGIYTVAVRILGFEEFKAVAIRIEPGKTTQLLIQLVESVDDRAVFM